ncbi:MAG: response regulator, partial [Lachnospiraceae bacterium]|nr:response regulator [Lachnospiraceae bacterium]
MRIGICDDDKGVREKIESYCREYEKINGCSFQYSSYESGEEVLLQAKEGKEDIDLLFLDIEMKGIDGIEVMKQIKNLSFVWRIVFVS